MPFFRFEEKILCVQVLVPLHILLLFQEYVDMPVTPTLFLPFRNVLRLLVLFFAFFAFFCFFATKKAREKAAKTFSIQNRVLQQDIEIANRDTIVILLRSYRLQLILQKCKKQISNNRMSHQLYNVTKSIFVGKVVFCLDLFLYYNSESKKVFIYLNRSQKVDPKSKKKYINRVYITRVMIVLITILCYST